MKDFLALILLAPVILFGQADIPVDDIKEKQFVLFDVEFTYTKQDADNSTPSKSHYYVKGDKINPDRTSPVRWMDTSEIPPLEFHFLLK